tara:strand:- start:820 stop:1485 length:666 start_codon:yes stop_codon:yes gene_type:complete
VGAYISTPTEINISDDELKKYYEIDSPKTDSPKTNSPKTYKFKMTDIGLYSISKPELAKWIANIMVDNLTNTKKLVITDATGGMGGDVIYFSKHFKGVNAVEINKIHFNILVHNLSNVLNIRNIKYYNNDYNKIYDKLQNDVVYIDPPWGGKNISKMKDIMLSLGKTKIYVLINKLHKKGIKDVFLKIPHNFYYYLFFHKIFYNKITVHKYHKVWLLHMQK